MGKKKQEERVLFFSAEEYSFIAKEYFDMGLFDRATELSDNARYLYQKIDRQYRNEEQYAKCLQMRAYILAEDGKFPESKKYYREAKKCFKLQKNNAGYADCLIGEGTLQLYKENYCRAVRLRKRALKILKSEPGTDVKQAKAYYYLGATYFKKNKVEKADECFTEALKKEQNDERLYFVSGYTKICLKRYTEALERLFTAQKLCEEKENAPSFPIHLGDVYLLIGDVYTEMKLPVKAVKFYARALKNYEANDRVTPTSMYKKTLMKLYCTYEALNEPENAKIMLRLWSEHE